EVLAHLRTIRIGRVDEVHAKLDHEPQRGEGRLVVGRVAPDAGTGDAHRSEAHPGHSQVAADVDGAGRARVDLLGHLIPLPVHRPTLPTQATVMRWSVAAALAAAPSLALQPAPEAHRGARGAFPRGGGAGRIGSLPRLDSARSGDGPQVGHPAAATTTPGCPTCDRARPPAPKSPPQPPARPRPA